VGIETLASRVTSKRLRAHALILCVCMWSVFVWNVSKPGVLDRSGIVKGADFIHLYTLGSVALAHRAADLYDPDAQATLTAELVPAAAGVRYIPLYPPQISIFFAPFAALPYTVALVVWLLLSASVYGFCCYLVWLSCPQLRGARGNILLLAFAFPGFFQLIVWGQTSAMALLCFAAAFFFWRNERLFLAGLALGCLIFKPQLGIAAAFVFVFTRAWRVIAGAILSATAQFTVPALYYGTGSLRSWLRMILNVTYKIPQLEPRPYQTHCLWTFWTMLIPGVKLPFGLYLLSASVTLGFAAAIWSHPVKFPLALRYSSLLLASVLVSPHLIVYDLLILAPLFLLLTDWILGEVRGTAPAMTVLLYLTFLAPLIGPLARWTHVQISVVLMSFLLFVIWRIGRTESAIVA
jgi:alpha-1,2-mannosyltransferase